MVLFLCKKGGKMQMSVEKNEDIIVDDFLENLRELEEITKQEDSEKG